LAEDHHPAKDEHKDRPSRASRKKAATQTFLRVGKDAMQVLGVYGGRKPQRAMHSCCTAADKGEPKTFGFLAPIAAT
jgi:hypothetical protein